MSKASEWLWEIENAQPEDKQTAIAMAFKHATRIDPDVDCDCCLWLIFEDDSILRIDEEDDIYNEVMK